MKYIHTETGEVWNGQPSTSRTSNFYLLTHEEKVAMGWELVEELKPSLESVKQNKKQLIRAVASGFIENKHPRFKRENASLGVYDNEYKQTLVSFINSVRNKVDYYDTLVDSAKTIEELGFEVNFDGIN